MLFVRRACHAFALSAAGLATLGALASSADDAHAQTSLQARYAVSVAGIPVGTADLHLDIAGGRYTASASGSASWFVGLLIDSTMRAAVHGRVGRDGPMPDLFVAQFADGMVTDQAAPGVFAGIDPGADLGIGMGPAGLAAGSPYTGASAAVQAASTAGAMADDDGALRLGRVAVAGRNVNWAEWPGETAGWVRPAATMSRAPMDPVSALLLPMTGAFDVLSAEICEHRRTVSSGGRRYDLSLSFKRMEQVKGAETGYSGPAIVCAVSLGARDGGQGPDHAAGGYLVRHLSDGRDIEMWFVPVAGTRLVAPYRAMVSGMPGPLEVKATVFMAGP